MVGAILGEWIFVATEVMFKMWPMLYVVLNAISLVIGRLCFSWYSHVTRRVRISGDVFKTLFLLHFWIKLITFPFYFKVDVHNVKFSSCFSGMSNKVSSGTWKENELHIRCLRVFTLGGADFVYIDIGRISSAMLLFLLVSSITTTYTKQPPLLL